jgi:hypothetical protein
MRRTHIRVAAAAAAGVAIAAMAPGWAGHSEGLRFSKPVRITPANGGGYEPGVYADRFGNIYATAHKENAELAVSPDSRSTTQTRSQSWAWYSSNGGAAWKDLPEGPGDIYNHQFGDEGDMAIDDANNLYMVDTDVTDITLTAWHIGNNGPVFDHANPLPGMAQPVDDRPWVTAHLNKHVLYFGNEGDKVSYPLGSTSSGPGSGPGRYTVYRSTDGGATFDHTGVTLKDSGWCRPAAAPHSQYVYAVCNNDGGADDADTSPGQPGYDHGMLYAFVSANDGKTWSRYNIASYNPKDSFNSWPTVQVMQDGSIWMSYVDGQTPGCTGGDPVDGYQCTPHTSRVVIAHSTDHGRHWTVYNATPGGAQANWQYRYGWLATASDNRTLGLAIYGRPYDKKKTAAQQAPWKVYGALFHAGERPKLTLLDPTPVTGAGFSSPPGDFLMCTFDAHDLYHAVYTRVVTTADTPVASAYVYRDIYAVNQL